MLATQKKIATHFGRVEPPRARPAKSWPTPVKRRENLFVRQAVAAQL
jgi:hypothetical protein